MTKPHTSKEGNSSPVKNEILIIETEDNIMDQSEIKTEPSTAFTNITVEESGSDNEELNSNNASNDHNYESPPAKRQKRYSSKYRKDWENKPELKSWLSASIHGNTYFYCKFCKYDYRCGISEIYKHMASKKHILRVSTPDSKGQRFDFRGLLCPVFTPFHRGRNTPGINYNAIPKYSDFLATCGVKGILINDIVGEGMSLTIKERMDVLESWVEPCKKNEQFLMVQIGGAPLKHVMEMAIHAQKLKVGAVVVLPDLYNNPKNHLDLIRYLKLISDSAKDIPILYHHNPKFSRLEINMSSLLVDIAGEVDTFVGLIYSTNDLQQITSVSSINQQFTVFMGTDEAILGATACGITCIMSATLNVLPKLVESICENVFNDKLAQARVSQNMLNKIVDILSREVDFVPALKVAMEILTNICGISTREPLQTIWEGTVRKIQLKLAEIGIK